MAILLMLAEGSAKPSLGPASVAALGRMGVTHLSLLQQGDALGLVLEGWSFDPGKHSEDAAALILGSARMRLFHPVMQMAVSPVGEATREQVVDRPERSSRKDGGS